VHSFFKRVTPAEGVDIAGSGRGKRPRSRLFHKSCIGLCSRVLQSCARACTQHPSQEVAHSTQSRRRPLVTSGMPQQDIATLLGSFLAFSVNTLSLTMQSLTNHTRKCSKGQAQGDLQKIIEVVATVYDGVDGGIGDLLVSMLGTISGSAALRTISEASVVHTSTALSLLAATQQELQSMRVAAVESARRLWAALIGDSEDAKEVEDAWDEEASMTSSSGSEASGVDSSSLEQGSGSTAAGARDERCRQGNSQEPQADEDAPGDDEVLRLGGALPTERSAQDVADASDSSEQTASRSGGSKACISGLHEGGVAEGSRPEPGGVPHVRCSAAWLLLHAHRTACASMQCTRGPHARWIALSSLCICTSEL
jgi:hypothetical protein